MPDTELARRTGVELVRTGSWQLRSGSWNPTRQDILAAIEAQNCPAVRRPRIKLGHTDERFAGDGEPALGWFENMRTSDGGHTLVADQVALPWLSSVQAAAYPDRSVEGNYQHRCALGHTHPFVITAVALLGVTPPGVSTLRSLQDLPDMLGVAASEEVPDGAQHVQVTIRAAADVHTGAMVALIPIAEDAARLAVQGGEPPEQLHVTLAYLGEAADLGAQGQQDVIDQVSTAANGLPVIDADVFSVAVFNPGDASDREPCLVYGLSGDMLDAVHDLIDESLSGAPIPEQLRPWNAHMTAVHTDDLTKLGGLAAGVGPVRFDRLRLAFAGEHVDIPLIGEPDATDPYSADPMLVAAAGMDDDQLKKYWLRGDGLKRWADAAHPWTTLYRLILKHVKDPDKAKRIASDWYRAHFGHMPNQKKGVKAGAGNGATPMPSRAELVRAAWNTSGAPVQKWVQEARPDAAVVVDDTDPDSRTYELYPVTFAGDTVQFGDPQPYDPAADKALVFASAAESRPGDPLPDPAPADTQKPPTEAASSILPAAEPEPEETPDPKEGLVSTDLSAFRSRLGLDDTADEAALLTAFDERLTKAEAPVEPTPEMVAASAAAETEKGELRKEVQVLASRMEQVTTELATAKAEKAATVKASVFDGAIKDGKITVAERETWEKDYDEAPAAVTRVLASIAVGTAVPVLASGSIGDPEPSGTDDEFEAMIARLDSPTGKVA
jgi:2'-5' RNA ligase